VLFKFHFILETLHQVFTLTVDDEALVNAVAVEPLDEHVLSEKILLGCKEKLVEQGSTNPITVIRVQLQHAQQIREVGTD
jgi:hypothetical protein